MFILIEIFLFTQRQLQDLDIYQKSIFLNYNFYETYITTTKKMSLPILRNRKHFVYLHQLFGCNVIVYD